MKKFNLNELSKSELKDEELNALKGGWYHEGLPSCPCKCICADYVKGDSLEFNSPHGYRLGSKANEQYGESAPGPIYEK